jgi:hypothetical protein
VINVVWLEIVNGEAHRPRVTDIGFIEIHTACLPSVLRENGNFEATALQKRHEMASHEAGPSGDENTQHW